VALAITASGYGCGNGNATGNATDYSLTFSVEPGDAVPVTIGALQFEVTYLGNNGGFIGSGDQIDCVVLVDAIVAGNDPRQDVARIGMISLQGFHAPSPIIRCGFRTADDLAPESFRIEVLDASDTNSESLDPPPVVVLSSMAPGSRD
jgi:hypothetical protein